MLVSASLSLSHICQRRVLWTHNFFHTKMGTKLWFEWAINKSSSKVAGIRDSFAQDNLKYTHVVRDSHWGMLNVYKLISWLSLHETYAANSANQFSPTISSSKIICIGLEWIPINFLLGIRKDLSDEDENSPWPKMKDSKNFVFKISSKLS